MMLISVEDILAAIVWPNRTDDAQKQNVRYILEEFQASGNPASYAIAAVVNSFAESQWRNDAFNPEGNRGWGSLGLFQAYNSGDGVGAAAGLSLPPMVGGRPAADDPRRDPFVNIELILAEITKFNTTTRWGGTDYSPSMLGAHESGQVFDVVSAFTRHIERPAKRAEEGLSRAQRARSMFPTLAGLPAEYLSWTGGPWVSRQAKDVAKTVGATVILLTLLVGLGYVVWRTGALEAATSRLITA